VIYRCKGNLCSDLLTQILEHCIVEVLGVVDCNVLGNAVAIDDILLEELFNSCGDDVCDRFFLNPLCEVLDCHHDEGVIALCWG
jgi:hypothetical protein